MKIKISYISFIVLSFIAASCIPEKNFYQGDKEDGKDEGGNGSLEPIYMYSFADETTNTTAVITIQTTEKIDFSNVLADIPPIKYNKSWIFMMTQDDASHSTYSSTWAAINGKPLIHVNGNLYYYDAPHLYNNDMPPNTYLLQKTLGNTDGMGREVRFAPTMTVWPEKKEMSLKANVQPGYTENFYRFYKKTCIVWDDVKDMLNYGFGLAFHDVEAANTKNPELIKAHFGIAQNILLEKLGGRGCKYLAEPSGNKNYITAAQTYEPIKIITAQQGAQKIYPFNLNSDLHKFIHERYIHEQAELIKEQIREEMALPKKERKALHFGVHNTADDQWVNFLLWLNNTYGKDGDDSVWFPNLEEYYEYNHYRQNGIRMVEIVDDQTLKVRVTLPSLQYFYYPSITLNLNGLNFEKIASIETNEAISGFSYAKFNNGITMNIDCRKHLATHAELYVQRYEKNKSNALNKTDAQYFVNMLKNSPKKDDLLKRIK